MTIEEIRKGAPYDAIWYAINSDGSVSYYQFKQNEGYRVYAWGWLGVNITGIDLKPLSEV